MSANDPILILQMQRMGDLVLSFPLLGWLGSAFPGHPLWVVGEPAFFEPLMPLSPQVTYFSYAGAPNFTHERFHAVINLSHRPEAARLAALARSDVLVGPYQTESGELHIEGGWQLYRASLTHNNHYNLYHWADLNALDLISTDQMLRTNWPLPRSGAVAGAPMVGARIGLFLGASEPDKHPDAGFWSSLALLLLKAGHKPVLLGGEAEKALGYEVASTIKALPLNLCGRFSVRTLAEFIAGLDLLITPDTGPMHVAVWSGTPVLNLSLGPVNPWETGPFSPGHHVVRTALDCIGCWRCIRPRVDCKEGLVAGRVAAIVEALLGARSFEGLPRTARGLELLGTERDAHGLFQMNPIVEARPGENFLTTSLREGALDLDRRPEEHSCPQEALALARHDLSLFWQAWFAEVLGRVGGSEPSHGVPAVELTRQAWERVCERHPQISVVFTRGIADMAFALTQAVRRDAASVLHDPDFWQKVPPLLRPLSGYTHMYVQNRHAQRESLLYAVSLVERLQALVL